MRKILLLMVLALFVGTVSAEMTGTAPNHQELGDITYSSSLSIGTNAGLNNAIRSTIFNPALRCDDVLPSGTTQQSFSRQNLPYQGTALSGRISRLRRSYPAARIQDSEWNNMIGELLNLISEKTSAVCFTTAVSGQVASQPQHDVLLNQLSSLLNLLGQYWQQPSTDAGLAERDRIAAQISAGTADSQEETGTPECEIDSENTDKVFCIYVDAPVCDFKSWPGGKGKGKGKAKRLS